MQNSLYICKQTNINSKEWGLELPFLFTKSSIWVYLTWSGNFNKHLIISIPFQVEF